MGDTDIIDSIHSPPSKRARRKPVSHISNFDSLEEKLLVDQAIEKSKLDISPPKQRCLGSIPQGPTFFPTVEEFEGNPLHYINKIRHIAEKYGICKIVPPKQWNPPFCIDMESKKKFQTKKQLLHRIQEGRSFDDGEDYCLSDYLKMAQEKTQKWVADKHPEAKQGIKPLTPDEVEQCYWDTVETTNGPFVVEYGNDVDSTEFGSGFPQSERGRGLGSKKVGINHTEASHLSEPKLGTDEFYKESFWNLNNIPNCPDSILQYVKVGINGINVPWMYFGNLFSTFCWHNEDNYLYSINYHHWGAPKQWYGVPGTKRDAEGLERVFKNILAKKMQDQPDLLHHITTIFSPIILQNASVPVYKLLQHPGEFIVTFPRAFHGGFSMGPNVGEAVNFATHDWIAHGADANERYRLFARPAVFSHDRLSFTMANHLEEQRSPLTCKLLVAELERVINEEITQREKLLNDGVRDVSEYITLPPNRVDQLDEDSANYDDKRLCFCCKHICFFSCVACECSRSKVSCLRHSHFMCRCPTNKRYLMIWSSKEDMEKTLKTVISHLQTLEKNCIDLTGDDDKYEEQTSIPYLESPAKKSQIHRRYVSAAFGSAKDAANHEGFIIDVSESSTYYKLPETGQRLLGLSI